MKALSALADVVVLFAGCSGSSTPGDASVDATTDTTVDGSSGTDAAMDAPADTKSGDAGADGSPCPPCGPKQVCCDMMGPGYGYCYAQGCLSCCGM